MKYLSHIAHVLIYTLLINNSCFAVEKTQPFKWPHKIKAAVNLAYDDAVNSQLDNALPALNKYKLKATFYLPLASETLKNRLADWRAAAAQGHELGNHTLFHQCSGAVANRNWLLPEHDLDKTSVAQMVEQVVLGNTMLHAIDGKTERTFTLPCLESQARDGNYLAALKSEFVAIKTTHGAALHNMNAFDPYAVSVELPNNITGATLIAMVKAAAKKGTMVNFTFHGIGGDHLSVSTQAHEELLRYLAEHPDIYWVDTFMNIMQYVKAQQKNNHHEHSPH